MISTGFRESFERLKEYCESEEYRGWDPYDGLNSRLFQQVPLLRDSRWARLAWIQLFKRSPVNLRKLAAVPKGYNAKGLGLFLTGYCNLYQLEPREDYLEKIRFLADQLLKEQVSGYSGSCWGYDFDWQARAFFQPRLTPTVVATSFVAESLFLAYEVTMDQRLLETALSAANFVQFDLNQSKDQDGNICFSYSPRDHTQVFNASLLGARLLAHSYHYTKKDEQRALAASAVNYVANKQQDSGAWSYGTLPFHQWIDNFHTGFNIECINDYMRYTDDKTVEVINQKALAYYLSTFFLPDGKSRYYAHKTFPIDIHAPAQLQVTLAKAGILHQHQNLADTVLDWTIQHMQNKQTGYFYYQYKKYFSSRIPYMRWAQAWMFYAFSYYFLKSSAK